MLTIVKDQLAQRWIPAQISRFLRREFPDRPSWHLAPETIYQKLYRPNSLLPRRPALSPLRTGCDHRPAHVRFTRRRRRFGEPMLSVTNAPSDHRIALSPATGKATSSLVHSITQRSLEITAATGSEVYFCDGSSPWR
ncbi:hypothetical protein ACAG26_26535 [Mycobacterium sp. pUA109]|uniref:hypothetical protein n=1 Tax=Mycobacterium sp. pUA109 TaxID=3238982 RepID=UPI00351B7EE4